MKVFKFGGASVKDAQGVRNLLKVLSLFPNEEISVVVSAMGKMTNAFENLLELYVSAEGTNSQFSLIEDYHLEIAHDLKSDAPEMDLSRLEFFLSEIKARIQTRASGAFDFEYDQLVSFGELLSTALVEAYLNASGLNSEWLDIRHVIRSNSKYRQAEVDWEESKKQAAVIKDHLATSGNQIVITQGFIAADSRGKTTTLGREGSDYTGAILAYLLDAEELTIWKDVPGMLNADPRWFKNTVKLDKISFREAIELSYYGASVIHPKTIQPIQNKGIPLYVKSFLNPLEPGTVIQESDENDSTVASYIFKPEQWLISVSSRDFSFIVEEHLTEIFDVLSTIGMKINLMQNSAISFSFCVDADQRKLDSFLGILNERYKIRYNTHLQLMTVRHYNEHIVKQLKADKEVLLEQRSRNTLRMVLRNKED